jgi:hypothetical protein
METSLNSAVFIAAGVVVLSIAAVYTCTNNGSKPTEQSIGFNEEVKQSNKQKSKSKTNKKKEKTKKSQKVESKNMKELINNAMDEEDDYEEVVPAPRKPVVNVTVEAPKQHTQSKLVTAPAPIPAPAPAKIEPVIDEPETEKKKKGKETPEQKAARLERQRQKDKENKPVSNTSFSAAIIATLPITPTVAPTTTPAIFTNDIPSYYPVVALQSNALPSEGWVELKKDKKKTVKVTPTADPTATTEAKDVTKSSVIIDAKKVGYVIGPKGSTMQKIQEKFSVEIVTPKESSSAVPPPAPSKAGAK